MRLLNFDVKGKLVLTDFSKTVVPPYAILSHRWGDNEVLFGDMRDDSYHEKAGYQKIAFCAKQASQDKLNYFWIDTCCIDKYNLRELGKAINSMYAWYQGAEKCYVFLPDVSSSVTEGGSPWLKFFRSSEWFTRGWTLQELIAPKQVEFFSQEGHRLGDKVSLEQPIGEITGIQAEALRGCPLENFSIAERMTWAKSRNTTQPEDRAYCLLGILNVYMAPSYNEGEERALERLQNELERSKSSLSSIPYLRNRQFVGRGVELARLEARLFRDQQTSITAITGAGGIGKSQLALELAYITKEKDETCFVFWLDASDPERLHHDYVIVAQKLQIAGWNDEDVDVQLLVKDRLEKEEKKRWLLVFDNVDDIRVEIARSSLQPSTNLMQYLPQSERGSAIFTTTDRHIVETIAKKDIVELFEMTPDAAEKMLDERLVSAPTSGGQQEKELLLKELSYVPLAIVHAAAYINRTNITFHSYRLAMIQTGRQSLELRAALAQDKLEEGCSQSAVTTTLLISLDRIHRDSPLAADYLLLIACMNRKDVLLDLLETRSMRSREGAINDLDEYALITRRPADSAVDVHQLVHLSIRGWLQKRQRLYQWTEKAISRLLEVFPNNNYGNRSKWRRLLPHAKYALSAQIIEQDHETRTELADRCALALSEEGRWKEAQELLETVVDIRRRVVGLEHPDTLLSMLNLASTYSNQGRYREAEELDVEVMETRRTMLGLEHPDTLSSMANLASTYSNQGRYREAEQLDVEVMETRRTVLGLDHPSTLSIMVNLASTYWKQGRYKEAEELGAQVVETMRITLGLEHPDTLKSMSNLASTYRSQGQWKEAEELQVEVMETRKTVFGLEHPDTLTSIANLAATYSSGGRYKEAEQLDVEVMETRRTVLGLEHPDTLTSMANLAFIYRTQRRFEEAERLGIEAMETRITVLGPGHPDTLTSIAILASTYKSQGRWKDAEELEIRVVETMTTVLGPEHPDTLSVMANLALTYNGQGRLKEAEEVATEVMKTRRTVLGMEHPHTLTSMANLALMYRTQKRYGEAVKLGVEVIETRRTVLGPEHPSTLMSMALLASTYKSQGRWKHAEELEIKVVETMMTVLGLEHPDTLSSMASLMSTYSSQGRWKEAEELGIKVMETRRTVLGPEHADTLKSRAILAMTYIPQGRWKEAEELGAKMIKTSRTVLELEHTDTLTTTDEGDGHKEGSAPARATGFIVEHK